MRHRLQPVALALLALAPAGLLSAAEPAGPLVVATYNVENYVAMDRRAGGVFRRDYPKPESAKRALRAVIRSLNADVLALQEMGSSGCLEELRRDLEAEGIAYPHATLAEAADPVRHLAVLSRIPLQRVRTYARLAFPLLGGTERVKRGVCEVELGGEDGGLTLFIVHLRSRFTERPEDPESALCRAAEATAVRDLILRRFPEPESARFLILGDFNDTKSSRPLRLLMKRGSRAVAVLLEAADPAGEAWTHWFRKEDSYTRVDHILVSPGLAGAVPGSGARIAAGADVLAASDHRPVSVGLDLSKLAPKKPPPTGAAVRGK